MTPIVAVYGTDRAWRAALEAAFRRRGVSVRTASRPAELAKCLADGAVPLVVTAEAGPVAAATTRWMHASPGETADALVHRAMPLLLPEGDPPA
jgi:hypothetical protein